MSSHLKKFLADVSTDSHKLKSFKADPRGSMKQAGVPDDQIDAVLSGDPKKIASHVGPIVAGDVIIVIML